MIKQISYIILTIMCSTFVSLDAQSLWKKSNLSSFRDAPEEDKIVIPEHYLAYTLSLDELKTKLANTPTEEDMRKGVSGKLIDLPMPDGTFETFEMYDSPVFASKLAEKYPSIKSYKGKSINTPGMNVRFDTGPYGFHAAIHSISGVQYIDPYSKSSTQEYLTYNVKDQSSQVEFDFPLCGNTDETKGTTETFTSKPRSSVPVALHVYRLALACTGEWGAQRGTVENVLADMNTTVNRVNQIYENELAMRLVLIDNNDLLINFDGATDPYSIVNNSPGSPNPTADESAALNVNTDILNIVIGQENYDIGHLYHISCDVGGIARLGSMCNNNSKGAGLTCHYTGLNYMAAQVTSHEIGHQMSAQHTFNNCSGNESPNNAFEPGSGSTIMSYGGTCGSNNVVGPLQDDDYYHVASLIQIYNYTRGGNSIGNICAEVVPTSNLEPTVSILHDNDFYIPEDTYFFLEGKAEDENSEDELTYTWEQMNLGNTSPLGAPVGDAPHFRSFPPSSSPVRYFPSADNIIAGNFDRTEVSFKGDRTVNFMFTARDNNAEAGIAVWEEVQFHVVETPVKFGVTSQSSSEIYKVGEEIDVTWNVAGTDVAPINTKNVDILLFTGTFFDFSLSNTTVLAKNVFNSGSCKVIVPEEYTTRGRIIVRASDSNYFSINSTNIRIEEATSPTLLVNSDPIAHIDCVPTNFIYEINSENHLGIEGDITYTILEGLPDGATATFEPQTVSIGTKSVLTIDPPLDPLPSEHEIRIGAITESMDTFSRLLYMNLRSYDHSALNPITPERDAKAIGTVTPFIWTASPNADFYKFELSKSPAFGSTNIASMSGLTELSYDADVFLDKNTVYYWRVTASNFCGDDPLVQTYAFSTESSSCSILAPASGVLPINISGSGKPTIQAPIDVNISGSISDINVKKFRGEHENNKDMVVSLISPEGKAVILVNRKCTQADFNCSFDDASNVNVKCPLSNGSVYIPEQPLSNFNGDPLQGTWIFQIEDTDSGNGGKLEEVVVEFCSNQVLDNPYIVTNKNLKVPRETTANVSSDKLKTEDDNNTSDELIYTIVQMPRVGAFRYNGELFETGDQFTQQDIDEGNLTYSSANYNYNTYFLFTVIDGEGGFIGVTRFNLVVNNTTAVDEEQIQDKISVYPIPARDLLTIDFSLSTQDYSSFEIINLNGQSVLKDNLKGIDKTNIDISSLTEGLYIINFKSNNNLISKKIIVF